MIHLKRAAIASVISLSLFTSSAYAAPSPTQDQVGGLTEFSNFLTNQSITSLTTLYNVVVGVGHLVSNAAQVADSNGQCPIKVGSTQPVDKPMQVGGSHVDKPMQVGTSGQRTPLKVDLGAPQVKSGAPGAGPKHVEAGSLQVSVVVKYVRYLYSPRWGWLDTRHFTAAANYATDHCAFKALLMGTLKEVDQLSDEEKSSFSYEDRVSNALGVYFIKEYSATEENKKLPFNTVLLNYLTALGFDEKPTEKSPNFTQLPKTDADVATAEVVRNYTYEPSFTTAVRDQEIDEKIEDFLFWLP